MVHIIIKTDGVETGVTTGGEAASATAQGPEAPGEVLATAAATAVTAQNAGAAPVGGPTGTGAPPPPAAAEPGVTLGGTDALAAGAAPGTPLEPPPAVVNEEGE
jgi:hypothetical protein